MARVIMPLIRKAYRDAGVMKGPELFDEAVVKFFGPFTTEELHDRFAPRHELSAVAPYAVNRIGERDPLGVARVPCVFGHAHLLGRSFEREGRKGRTAILVH